ncbi:YcgL domain-containing protein [Actinobacillus capsulatus]|uniref:YcgL domain-containing protein n=1 Tax=Actinobacillus capsulatus TaxID=717 RepID=UPI00036A6587|nr:YcgL domain-containing protein [Actinobacillus capsulatus]
MSTNLCAIYKSPKREEMFLYVAKRDQFDSVPEELRQMFGKPQFVMLFNLNGEKQLKRSKNEEVLQAIQTQGFFLQMPPPPENLLKTFLEQNRGET